MAEKEENNLINQIKKKEYNKIKNKAKNNQIEKKMKIII